MLGKLAYLCIAALLVLVNAAPSSAETFELRYAPARIDNPLKGLVPYAGSSGSTFPHSLEFEYIAFADVVKGKDVYNWRKLDELIEAIASRGHQSIFRVYVEYPGKPTLLPAFLKKQGIKLTRYESPGETGGMVETPDYTHPALRRAILSFVAAMGQRYDGDARIGFITAGLLGHWGEWHSWPRQELFPDKAFQAEVMQAYERAFRRTPVLLRYPTGDADPSYAANDKRPFGYHDDSFAWATLATGKDGDEWFYMARIAAAGPAALTKWQAHPIGGEIRPEAWGKVFDRNPGNPEIQDFASCVNKTHATWLMDSGMFEGRNSRDRIARAEGLVRRMGYELHVSRATVGKMAKGKLSIAVSVGNRGVAPFYADWPVHVAVLRNGKAVKHITTARTVAGILPGSKAELVFGLPIGELPGGHYVIAMAVPNPMQKGQWLHFANAEQNRDAEGWLSLGNVKLP